MSNPFSRNQSQDLSSLALDPDLLAAELAAEEDGDPFDAISPDREQDTLAIARACDQGLIWLGQNHEQRLQGLRIFCEYRDLRSVPKLLALLDLPCPVERMSAVYALGRNPATPAVEPLLQLLEKDSNAYVRKAAAWSLGNYRDAPVLNPLIRSLHSDVASVRIWCPGSLAETSANSPAKADVAAGQLLISLRVDSEPVVRCNCIWALGRLYNELENHRQKDIINDFLGALLNEKEASVHDEARIALEQLDDPMVKDRLQLLIDDGFLS